MHTLLTRDASEAARILVDGGVVAFPTETVYGLGARADRPDAVRAIFEAKQRPADNPLIVHVSDPSEVSMVAAYVPDAARRLMKAFWPGPLTLVLPARDDVPRVVTAGLNTVGVRMPDHPEALALIREAGRLAAKESSASGSTSTGVPTGIPVAAPSANRSGRPSPTTWEAVHDDLSGRIAAILQGNPARVGLESTVVDATTDEIVVLRPGGISMEALRSIVSDVRMAGGQQDDVRRSPGTRHPHYRPEARVRWVGPFVAGSKAESPSLRAGYIGLNAPPQGYERSLILPDTEAYATALFRFFRECEQAGLDEVHCERIEALGIGRALVDRIDRAAAAD